MRFLLKINKKEIKKQERENSVHLCYHEEQEEQKNKKLCEGGILIEESPEKDRDTKILFIGSADHQFTE